MTNEEVENLKSHLDGHLALITQYKDCQMHEVVRVMGCFTFEDIGKTLRYLERVEKAETGGSIYDRFTVEFPDLKARRTELYFDRHWGISQNTEALNLEFVFNGSDHWMNEDDFRDDFIEFIRSEVSDYYQSTRGLMSATVDFGFKEETFGAVVVTPHNNMGKPHGPHTNEFVLNPNW
tara:strand:+ start:13 stop:546 length:534 start_codon:yes stop_codon:yes gene_type:complete